MLDRIHFHASSSPNQLAIKSESGDITYQKLYQRASDVANHLKSLGLYNSCIGINLPSKTEEIIACLGVLLSENYFFFLPKSLQSNWQEHVPVKFLISNIKNAAVDSIDLKDIPFEASESIDAWREKVTLPDRLFCVYATSGSSGSSKYVIHDYASIIEDSYRQVSENQISASDTLDFIFASSFSSSLASIFPALISGASIAVVDLKPENLKEIPLFWKSRQISFATLTSSSFRILAAIYQDELIKYTQSIRFLCLAGERIMPSDLEIFRKFFPKNAVLQLAYASTEARTISEIKISYLQNFPKINEGIPVKNKSLTVVDANGNPCQPGEPGELTVSSTYISLGYFENKEINYHPKVGDKRIFRTGDFGLISSDGFVSVIGRTNSRQKVNGKWVDLQQMETQLQDLFKAKSCKVLLSKDENGLEYLIACLEVEQMEADEQFYTKTQKLKGLEVVPRSYLQVLHYPLNTHGKINQEEIVSLSKKRDIQSIQSQITDPILQGVHTIWCKNLGIPITNLEADFFSDLGGSSLLSVLVVEELSAHFNQEIETHAIFQYRSLRKLADHIRGNEPLSLPCLHWISAEVKDSLPFLFLIETGHYFSFQNFLEKKEVHQSFNLAYLRINQFKILEGFSAEKIILELVDLLAPYPNPILLGNSFNGYLAAKLQEQTGGAIIAIDSPFYQNAPILKIPLKNRLLPILYRFRNLPLKESLIQVSGLLIGYGKKKLSKEKSQSPFENSIQAFVSQCETPRAISAMLYFYATGSAMTSKKDIRSWQEITKTSFSLAEIKGDHLDALSEANSAFFTNKILEFIHQLKAKE
ncbi:Acyl-CoA synthetase (AMP-forming)/AMP-acid ligase II [Algoriphagus faecimaris]|uniref:Acyl-CoA synthetase (AMP-forming)/AMP-acid ligase II n=1 Tax=Algoriphagus faecimaris TaxID=686796 RepID=A0A1G6NRG9_9BACT|nr:non-ribosomal peptide synthetase [Algoriphagus faecimaris]SDC70271.1 Acyl-CoA synthetase (AMP-forming)/AMP-acid ligase II [Algoriphagus faecimaris]